MRYLTLLLLLLLAVCQPNPAPAEPPSAAPMAVPYAPPHQAIAATSAHGRGSPLDRWKIIAMAACERHGCDGRLLIAIGIVETGNDPRGAKAAHSDKVSYGRYGMQATTAAYHLMGAKYSHVKNLLTDDVEYIVKVLGQELWGAEIAAQHLRWCMDRPRVRTSRNPRASAAHCWNPNDSAYPGKVMAEYRKMKEGR